MLYSRSLAQLFDVSPKATWISWLQLYPSIEGCIDLFACLWRPSILAVARSPNSVLKLYPCYVYTRQFLDIDLCLYFRFFVVFKQPKIYVYRQLLLLLFRIYSTFSIEYFQYEQFSPVPPHPKDYLNLAPKIWEPRDQLRPGSFLQRGAKRKEPGYEVGYKLQILCLNESDILISKIHFLDTLWSLYICALNCMQFHERMISKNVYPSKFKLAITYGNTVFILVISHVRE